MHKSKTIFVPAFFGILCAVGVFSVLFTDSGHRFQSAIIESDMTSSAQAQLISSDKKLDFKVNVTATNVTKITGIMLYDDTSIVVSNPSSSFGTVNIVDEGMKKVLTITFPSPITIKKGTTLITWDLTPLLPESHVVNLANVVIHMTDDTLPLTSTGTGEF